MKKYQVTLFGKKIYEFEAKSERAAKIRTSKYVNSRVGLCPLTTGISLYCEGKFIASYMPFFFQWL